MSDALCLVHGDYEYAGFHYEIYEDEYGNLYGMPLRGQHVAANKQKHRIAAAVCFDEDYKWSKRKCGGL